MSRKIRVAVLYGGRSGEHEVALQSGASVIYHLDKEKFEVVAIGVDKNGKWHLAPPQQLQNKTKSLPVFKDEAEVWLPAHTEASEHGLLSLGTEKKSAAFDVLFPVMHGTMGEDGTIQGLFELADVAYVGCGVLASAVGMDKDVAKKLVSMAGVPVAPYLSVKQGEWSLNTVHYKDLVQKEIGYPCFVKPSNSGSSVGIHKVKKPEDLGKSIDDAFRYDTKVLIETAVNAREIELSVLENKNYGMPPRVSVAGEVIPQHEFYSYEAKYLDDNGASLKIPSELTSEQLKEAQKIARDVFAALECEGMARVDLFLDKNNGKFYFNEINTIPGFTSISMYPKMWEASGLKYKDLLTELIELAIARHERRKKIIRDFTV